MGPKTKQKWVDALRSGDYKKGRFTLRIKGKKQDKFCCLGVLCDIIQPKKWLLKTEAIDVTGEGKQTYFVYENEYESSILPRPLREKLKLDGDVVDKLICMNDEENKSFKQIADYVEKNL